MLAREFITAYGTAMNRLRHWLEHNIHIHIFRKRFCFIWGFIFPVDILKEMKKVLALLIVLFNSRFIYKFFWQTFCKSSQQEVLLHIHVLKVITRSLKNNVYFMSEIIQTNKNIIKRKLWIYFTHCSGVFIVDFEHQVNASWVNEHLVKFQGNKCSDQSRFPRQII